MANHKSAAKRARQDKKKNARNSNTKASIRTFEKKLRVAITEKKADVANDLLKSYASKMYKAAQKGIHHANTAARKVGRLSAQVNNLK